MTPEGVSMRRNTLDPLLIGVVPNFIAAFFILGIIGLLEIPLDMMPKPLHLLIMSEFTGTGTTLTLRVKKKLLINGLHY